MGRLVRTAAAPRPYIRVGVEGGIDGVTRPASGAVAPKDGDGYLARVAKYIPAEIIAFVIFTNGILKQPLDDAVAAAKAQTVAEVTAAKASATMAGFEITWIGVAVFFLAWAIVPVYLWRQRTPGDGAVTTILLAVLLFPIWAYATETVGVTNFVLFDGQFASLVLAAATLLSGIVMPPESKPAQNGEADAA